MDQSEIKEFFECLGEIWRDITAIEFLMRCAIASYDGEKPKIPEPPFHQGRTIENYPEAFKNHGFGEVVRMFNERFQDLQIPDQITQLRHAMAHGLVSVINNEEHNQLVKFREVKNGLKIEFSTELRMNNIKQIRQSLKELRGYIMKKVND